MRLVFLILVLISSSALAEVWKTEFFSISIPSRFLIEETQEPNNFLAFVPHDEHGHPKELLILHFSTNDKFEEIITEANKFLLEIGGKLKEAPCNPSCKLFVSETQLTKNGAISYHFQRIIKTKKQTKSLAYSGAITLDEGRNFINNVQKQINNENI